MWLLASLVASALVVAGTNAQEAFEYLTYIAPPGWSVGQADAGRQYLRNEANGIGIISLLASRPAVGAPADMFADLWRAQATKIIAGAPPQPTSRQVGDATVLTRARQVRSQGTTVHVVVAAVLRGDRVLGVMGTAAGPERHAELEAFFNSLGVAPSAGAAAPPARDGEPAGAQGELGFDVPTGYVQQRNGDIVILAPATASERTPCLYGLVPPRPASSSLEADAEAAVVQTVVPGWRRLDDRHAAMRGTAAAGWPYAWYRAAFEQDVGGERQAVNAMALVLPAGQGRVHVVWGMGGISRCLLDDPTFEQLFHSLRPPGWASDGGRALTRALVGTWRYTASAGVQQLVFRADGRYERDLGSRAQLGVMEQTSATVSEGRFTVRDGELTLVPDHRPQDPDRYYVRVYQEWFLSEWRHVLTLYDARANPPLVIPYFRVVESP
jgi:hypothetical protein